MRQCGLEIGEVNDLERNPAGVEMVGQEFSSPTGQVVKDHDLVTTLDQAVDHMRPNEARSTRDQPAHGDA
jgi:hypothetical protein